MDPLQSESVPVCSTVPLVSPSNPTQKLEYAVPEHVTAGCTQDGIEAAAEAFVYLALYDPDDLMTAVKASLTKDGIKQRGCNCSDGCDGGVVGVVDADVNDESAVDHADADRVHPATGAGPMSSRR